MSVPSAFGVMIANVALDDRVARARTGDGQAFDALAAERVDRLYAVATLILGEPRSRKTPSRRPSSERGATCRASTTRTDLTAGCTGSSSTRVTTKYAALAAGGPQFLRW
jgi:hypothetical protein